MKSIMVVDDELLIRSQLKNLIEKNMDDYFIVSQVENGKEALKVMERRVPDIVISDIRMPVMDGVEFVKQMRILHPGVPIIILSNYDDYQYVKETMKNGVFDYLLKHELNEENLHAAIMGAGEKCSEHEKNKKRNQAEDYLRKNQMVLRNEFLTKLLTDQYKDEIKMKQTMDMLEIPLEMKRNLPCLMILSRNSYKKDDVSLKQRDLHEFSVLNITNELITEWGDGFVGSLGDDRYMLILSLEKSFGEAGIHFKVHALLTRIMMCMKNYMNYSACFITDQRLRKLTEMNVSYIYLSNIMENRFFYGESSIISGIDPQKSGQKAQFSGELIGLSIQQEKKLIECMERGEDGLEVLLPLFQEMREKEQNLSNARMILSDLLSLLNTQCKKKKIPLSYFYGNGETIDEVWKKFVTIDAAEKWFVNAFQKMTAARKESESVKYSYYIAETLRQVRENYGKDISLSDIADKLKVSNSYLSRLFKEEVKVGFVDYLTDTRINMSIQKMADRNLSMNEIAKQCGFTQYTYFANVFRKKTGLSPRDYRKTM